MAYADITKPVIIQASKSLSAKVDEYLRRMCILSCGGTTLGVGESREVSISSYSSILNDQIGSETLKTNIENKLRGFFAYAGSKDVQVLELGAFDADTNTIANQVTQLRTFINNASPRCYIYLVPEFWYYPNISMVPIENTQIHITHSLVMLRTAIPEGETLPADVSEPVTEALNQITSNASDLSVQYSNEGVAEFDKATGKIKALSEGETTITLSGKVDSTKGDTAIATFQVIVGAWNEELNPTSTQAALINTPINVSTNNGFESGGRDLSFSALAAEYTALNSTTFFFIEMTKNEDPSISQAFELYKNKKSVFVVYDNLQNSQLPLISMILGLCASDKFDLGASQTGSPLNYKLLSGQTPSFLSSSLLKNLIQAPANFAGSLAGNPVVLNGRYCDGVAWEYYYQWDTIEFNITKKLQTLLLNSANSKQSVVVYNQNGLDILKANIKSELLRWKEYGVITAFSRSYDQTTMSLVGEDDIEAIDFYTYVAQNPDKYENEIYDGFSFYVMVSRYVRQIIISAEVA